jgi:hypothetical protein
VGTFAFSNSYLNACPGVCKLADQLECLLVSSDTKAEVLTARQKFASSVPLALRPDLPWVVRVEVTQDIFSGFRALDFQPILVLGYIDNRFSELTQERMFAGCGVRCVILFHPSARAFVRPEVRRHLVGLCVRDGEYDTVPAHISDLLVSLAV